VARVAQDYELGDAAAIWRSQAVQESIAELRQLEFVDYRECYRLKREALQEMARMAWEKRGTELEAFASDTENLDLYARFRACMELTQTTWQAWGAAQQAGTLGSGDYRAEDWRYHVFVQHALSKQLSALRDAGAELYLDLSVGASGSSFDRWRYAEHFAAGADVGAPPDGLFEGGQNWALPPLHPRSIRRLGHEYFKACIRTQMQRCGMLRIDHVMGLHRLFWIPDGMPGTEGLYVRYPANELYAVLCLESQRAQCAVAGEDLGTVPEQVRPLMLEHGIHGLYVGQFASVWNEQEQRLDLQEPPASSIASLGTHDTPTFAGWFETTDLQEEPEELMRRWTEFLAAGPAAAVLVSLEDLWLEREPQNRPGTTDEVPNWRHRMQRDLNAIRSDVDLRDWLKRVAQLRA
jgi:4-alpha-glucanotransferase